MVIIIALAAFLNDNIQDDCIPYRPQSRELCSFHNNAANMNLFM